MTIVYSYIINNTFQSNYWYVNFFFVLEKKIRNFFQGVSNWQNMQNLSTFDNFLPK